MRSANGENLTLYIHQVSSSPTRHFSLATFQSQELCNETGRGVGNDYDGIESFHGLFDEMTQNANDSVSICDTDEDYPVEMENNFYDWKSDRPRFS